MPVRPTRWLGCSHGRQIGGAVSDYGRSVEFGISLTPNADDYQQLVEQAELADRLGLEYVGAQDHPYQRRFLDTLTLLAALAARTTRVRLFPDVANLPLRPPAMLDKAAASLDVPSVGRFELGLGAGAFWDAIWAMGGREDRQARPSKRSRKRWRSSGAYGAASVGCATTVATTRSAARTPGRCRSTQ
jgi:alkanesulfonate monooxygenase SsuD/methylene tetrahydromethanopterin reductase-like flavin-dependent oxidoreductase (luciferase family)